jgi:integral membrane protein
MALSVPPMSHPGKGLPDPVRVIRRLRRVLRDSARVFRLTAVAEAFSWAGLLVGMFFKYVVIQNPIGVQIFGRVHGALFVAYLAALIWVAVSHRWSPWRTVVGAAAAVPPFASVIFERWTARRSTT